MTVEIANLAAMEAFGRTLAGTLKAGDVIALAGPLGAGKTQLARAICEGLACPQAVTSPTFTLIHEYRGRLPVYHFDVYRLKSIDEFLDLGAMEYLCGDGVCIIEWADRVKEILPVNTRYLTIDVIDSNRRRILLD